MPKRSTPFQKVVYHIQEQLSSGAVVTESMMLENRQTGFKREVDVVIEAIVGEHALTICLECVEHMRASSVTWVESMIGKHKHLPTDRLVLVSSSGFSAQAKILAEKEDVDVMTPEEACDADWVREMGSLFVARLDITPLSAELTIDVAGTSQRLAAGFDTQLSQPSEKKTGTLGQLCLVVCNNPNVGGRALKKTTKDGTGELAFSFTLGEPVYAKDNDGNDHLVREVHLKGKTVRRTSKLPMKTLSWKGSLAAFGEGKTVIGNTTVTSVRIQDGTVTTKLLVEGKKVPVDRPSLPEFGAGQPGAAN